MLSKQEEQYPSYLATITLSGVSFQSTPFRCLPNFLSGYFLELIDDYLLDARARARFALQGYGPVESAWLPKLPDSVGGREPLHQNGRSGVHPDAGAEGVSLNYDLTCVLNKRDARPVL